jgi:NADH:ubiquinone reductase (H+-translocating)
MIDWTFDVFFEKDISVLFPAPEDVLRAIHLEAGELLMEEGSPVRAFFYVRSGEVKLGSVRGEKTFGPGSVLDQEQLDENDCWSGTAVAATSSDLIAFRGRAFDLLRTDLRLVPQTTRPGGRAVSDQK